MFLEEYVFRRICVRRIYLLKTILLKKLTIFKNNIFLKPHFLKLHSLKPNPLKNYLQKSINKRLLYVIKMLNKDNSNKNILRKDISLKNNNPSKDNPLEDKLIEITNDTPVIQPYGIKVELYLHQKVLVQKILDIMQHKIQFYDSNDVLINNKNIWLKSSIGTGKSLILLSVI